ncbi:MDGA2 [Branchiostoma lanceolatum]|uniref:MDGA2 protein n=1 Tax=Branchiostoma lanceolatum TaxID=7740 RepID=A0A8J9ZQ72_BRALA|nr:MDGA2 [Branchiostoma lanceolatum]
MPMTAMTTGLPRPFWTCLLVIALPGTVFTTVAPDIEVISAWPSANLYFEESLTLTCHGGGDPAPTYTWTRDSGSLPARAVVDGGAGTLTLADATDADGGVYTCTADNGVGTSATLNITVVGCPDVSTCPDSNSNCASWAAGGQCESNPGYMLSACRLSCGVCFPNLGAHCTTTRRGRSWDTWECYDVTSVPDAIRTELNLDTFYQKYLHAYGIPVLGSSILPDDALRRACYDVLFMLADRKDIRDSYYDYYGRAGIMAETEVTLDIPEHSGLDPDFNTRARGLGATVSKPVSTGAEENVLCYNTDPYKVEDIFIHEFAHGVDILGARKAVSDFITRLQAAYDSALANGLWANTYADDTRDEYWAEGVQSYFNVNHESDPPDGIHNHVNTRVELQAYDPDLYAMVEEIYPCGNFPVKRCERDYASYTLKIDCFSENYQRLTVVGTAVWGETSTSTAASQGRTVPVFILPMYNTDGEPDACCKHSDNTYSKHGRAIHRFYSNSIRAPVIISWYNTNCECDVKSNNENTSTVHSGADAFCKYIDSWADAYCKHPDAGADAYCKHPDAGADAYCKHPDAGADAYCKHPDAGADAYCKHPDGWADAYCKHPDGWADTYCKHPNAGADVYYADSKHPDGSDFKISDNKEGQHCNTVNSYNTDCCTGLLCKDTYSSDYTGDDRYSKGLGAITRYRCNWNYISDWTHNCRCHVQHTITINCCVINYNRSFYSFNGCSSNNYNYRANNYNCCAFNYNPSCYIFNDDYHKSDRLELGCCSPGTGTVRTTPTLVTRLVTTVNATESLPKPPGTDIVTIVAGVLGGVACVLVIAGAIGAVVKCMAAKTAVVAVKPA